jgi:ribulose-bisphosphate carboxylase large chain
MEHDVAELCGDNLALTSPFFDLKPVFPVASGGPHPGGVHKEIRMLGRDIILQAGGGIHGHPDGTRAGACAMRQAVDAAVAGIPPATYAAEHPELKRALDKWGIA